MGFAYRPVSISKPWLRAGSYSFAINDRVKGSVMSRYNRARDRIKTSIQHGLELIQLQLQIATYTTIATYKKPATTEKAVQCDSSLDI